MQGFENKVAIVSGATRGIGREIALSFAKNSCIIIGLGTNESLLAGLRSELQSINPKNNTAKCDVSNENDVRSTVDSVISSHGRIDILINNAGITRDNILLRMTESEWDSVFDINLKGVFLLSKHCLKHMVRQKWGRIINISSITALIGNKGQSNYAASKAGIVAFTKSTAKEVASRGITVNAILPGFIETDMTKGLPMDQIIQSIPVGRLGKTSDIAGTVLFLASDDAGYITGATLVVDGGLSINALRL